jgi:DNA primase
VSDCPTICFDGDAAGQKAALRAINRALPYLEPGKSLRFVTLPAKLDPDDIVRKQGKAAFDGFLADAKPLDQFLWTAEQFAEPLGTPEARAGFGKRLRDHARMIRDEDVCTQYLAVFSQRLREFFAPSERTGRKFISEANFVGGNSQKVMEKIATVGIDQATIIPAVFSALIVRNALVGRYAESIGRLNIASRELRQFRQLLFDAALSGPSIDVDAFAEVVRNEGLGAVWKALNKSNGLAFSFLRADTEPAKAETDLAAVIEKLAASTEIREQLVRLEEKLKSSDSWTEAGFDEQARLRAAEFSAMEQLKALLHGDDENII